MRINPPGWPLPDPARWGLLLGLLVGLCVVLLDPAPAAAADLRVAEVRIEACPAGDAGRQPELRRSSGAVCYVLRGVVTNPTRRPIVDTDVYARILDASGEPVLPNRTRVGSLGDVQPGSSDFALRLAIREFDLLIKNGMSKEDFEATRTFLRSYTKLYAQSPAQQLGWVMDSRFYGRQDYLAELDALLAKATLNDVNQAIRKHWQTDNMFVTIVTDDSEAKPLADSLINNTPSPMSYSNLVKSGLPAEVLAEDEEVAAYQLNVKKVTVVASADTFK